MTEEYVPHTTEPFIALIKSLLNNLKTRFNFKIVRFFHLSHNNNNPKTYNDAELVKLTTVA